MRKILFVCFLILIVSCYNYTTVKVNSDLKSLSMRGKHNNVCEELKGNTVFYFVFVDEKNASPWSNFSVNEAKKSIKQTTDWMSNEAKKNNVDLAINVVYHSLKDSVHAIEKNLPYKSVDAHLFYAKDGKEKLHKWSDNIAELVNADIRKSNKLFKKEVKSRDDLIINLQNIYKTKNIALVYLINNTVRKETSVSFFTEEKQLGEGSTEYTIISEPFNSAVIAHEIMHLFGADDFYRAEYSLVSLPKNLRKKYKQKYGYVVSNINNKTCILREYPNDIMKNINVESIDSLSVSPITRYLIGWDNKEDLSTRDKEFMLYGDYIEID